MGNWFNDAIVYLWKVTKANVNLSSDMMKNKQFTWHNSPDFHSIGVHGRIYVLQ